MAPGFASGFPCDLECTLSVVNLFLQMEHRFLFIALMCIFLALSASCYRVLWFRMDLLGHVRLQSGKGVAGRLTPALFHSR